MAAHPDDETFGCGAAIARKRAAGSEVWVFIATDGRNANPASKALSPEQLGAIRRAEAIEVCAILGVPEANVVQPGFAHLRDPTWRGEVGRQLEALLDDFHPAEVLVNSRLDYHPDHKAVNGIVRHLLRGRSSLVRAAEYPVWYLYDGPWPTSARALAGRPTVGDVAAPPGGLRRAWDRVSEPLASIARLRPFKVVCGPYLATKRDAVAAYRSQTSNFTGEEEWSFLGEDFVSVFLQPEELFFPISDPSSRRMRR